MRARNEDMIARIEAAPARAPLSFVVAGDSGAWADPTADAIFSSLVERVARLDPPPAFFVNLGDFAGPGTCERHERYLQLVEPLAIPNLCVVGNHDLDDARGEETWREVHGPMSFDFACGDTRFFVLRAAPGVVGEMDTTPEQNAAGLPPESLAFLAERLEAATERQRVVFMHMPPAMDGRYAPHEDWGFTEREDEFFALLEERAVRLVCCAHGLAFDDHVHRGVRVVMSGGGGTGLCSHLRGVCSAGRGHPEDRGALFHAVELTLGRDGDVSGRILQAFDRDGERDRRFGD